MPRNDIAAEMLRRYGVLIGGGDLRAALGFRSAASFQRAVRQKTLAVRVFPVPGRRGKFALTADVAAWLNKVASQTNEENRNEK
jgi:hypothetical protein